MPSRVNQFAIHFRADMKVKGACQYGLGLELFVGYLFSRSSVVPADRLYYSLKTVSIKECLFYILISCSLVLCTCRINLLLLQSQLQDQTIICFYFPFLIFILMVTAKLCVVTLKKCSTCNFTSTFNNSHDICIRQIKTITSSCT